MNSQRTNPPAHPDNRIDHVLEALRTAAPAGLEQRIAARLAQAAEARTQSKEVRTSSASPIAVIQSLSTATGNSTTTPFFAVILNAVKDPLILFARASLYKLAAALTLLFALISLTLLYHPTSTQSQSAPAQLTAPRRTFTVAHTKISQGSSREARNAVANVQVPRGFSLGSHSPTKRAVVSTPAPQQQPDPDTIALAETRAPSHPAPPMPLTSQEQLMVAATRPGQPIQLAELDLAREPILRAAAKSHEEANLQRYIRSLLAPFAIADSLSPTTFSRPQEIAAPAPAPQSSTSVSN